MSNQEGNTMDMKLEKGIALIINGAQGSGKTTLAISIAKKRGTYRSVRFCDIKGARWPGSAVRDRPDTVIVEDFSPTPTNVAYVKSMMLSDKILVNRKGELPYLVNTPVFIFCTKSKGSGRLPDAGRRFRVIDLP